ncbi:MAG: hypothetical protein KatS3mg009_3291 [Acidimicrobiia bacterium]|nr:MAG: hypothetical protein KatS3mg009_3291 [Acidimicrobiia bacterium]
MAGRHRVEPQLPAAGEQLAELHRAVAVDTRVRRATRPRTQPCTDRRPRAREVVGEVEHVVRDAELRGDAPRVLDVRDAAAARVALAAPQLERDAGDLVTLLDAAAPTATDESTPPLIIAITRTAPPPASRPPRGPRLRARARRRPRVDAQPRLNRTHERARCARSSPIASSTWDGLDRPAAARRPRRGVHTRGVERDQERLGLDARRTTPWSTPATRARRVARRLEALDRRPRAPRSSASRSARDPRALLVAPRVGHLQRGRQRDGPRRRSASPPAGPARGPRPRPAAPAARRRARRAPPRPSARRTCAPRSRRGPRLAGVARRSSHCGACTASVCSTARGARSRTSRATSPSGCTIPVSLLTSITDTTAVRSSSAPASRSQVDDAADACASTRRTVDALGLEPRRPRRAPPCARSRS